MIRYERFSKLWYIISLYCVFLLDWEVHYIVCLCLYLYYNNTSILQLFGSWKFFPGKNFCPQKSSPRKIPLKKMSNLDETCKLIGKCKQKTRFFQIYLNFQISIEVFGIAFPFRVILLLMIIKNVCNWKKAESKLKLWNSQEDFVTFSFLTSRFQFCISIMVYIIKYSSLKPFSKICFSWYIFGLLVTIKSMHDSSVNLKQFSTFTMISNPYLSHPMFH